MKAKTGKHGEFYHFVKSFNLPIVVVAPDIEAEVLDEDDLIEVVVLNELEEVEDWTAAGGWVELPEAGLSDAAHDAACGTVTPALKSKASEGFEAR